MLATYDDEQELEHYVERNFDRFIAPLEKRIYYLAIKRDKALATPSAARRLRSWFAQETPDVIAASAAGISAIKQQIRQRIRTDLLRGELLILRCSKCQRIVRTPLAQQCLWCGHDWHATN